MTDSVLTSEYTGFGGPDAGLDELLGSALSQGVPEDVLKGVTPWKKAMKLVFAGLVLSLLGIDIYNIDLAVNIAGNILCILGFRRLRRENWSFGLCSVLSNLAAAVNIARLVLNCMGRRLELARLVWDRIAGGTLMALMIATLVFFLIALKLVEKKSGIPLGTGFAKNVLIWYVVIRAMLFWYGYRQSLGVLPSHMFVFCVLLAAAIALCLHALYRLAKELEDPGYAIKASNPKVPDIAVVAVLVAISVALLAGSFATRNYPDNWKEYAAGHPRGTQKEREGWCSMEAREGNERVVMLAKPVRKGLLRLVFSRFFLIAVLLVVQIALLVVAYGYLTEKLPILINLLRLFTFAMVIYLFGMVGILFALIGSKESPYVGFHVRQALKISVCAILNALLMFTIIWIPFGMIVSLILLVVRVLCFFQICSGKAKEPPIVRSLGFLK